MEILYRFGVTLYHRSIRIASLLGHQQAQEWVTGRQQPIIPIQKKSPTQKTVWMHCASLGEWEQGRPVLEEIRRIYPEWFVLLTFYSPSGYKQAYDTHLAHTVYYLPADNPHTASQWLQAIKPDISLFVKYEFWYYHLQALHTAGVPTYLLAASFREDQIYFQRIGGFFRKMLTFFDAILVQTPHDKELLLHRTSFPGDKIEVTGDPRLDRTIKLANKDFKDDIIENFIQHDDRPIIMLGSIWPADIEVWKRAWKHLKPHYRLIIAPHKMDESNLLEWTHFFDAIRYTHTHPASSWDRDVMILDTIGILSRAYRYAHVAYVGGAFKSGLHNTLEPMSYKIPVAFGPKYKKFPEAQAAIQLGGAYSISQAHQLVEIMIRWLDPTEYSRAQSALQQFIHHHQGAAKRTAEWILQDFTTRT